MKKQQIRESIYKLLEEQTKFQPGDTVSTSKDGEGSIVLSKHPYYSVKLDTTGVTKSYHFTELQQVEPTESEFGKYDIGDENSQENELDGLQEIKIDEPRKIFNINNFNEIDLNKLQIGDYIKNFNGDKEKIKIKLKNIIRTEEGNLYDLTKIYNKRVLQNLGEIKIDKPNINEYIIQGYHNGYPYHDPVNIKGNKNTAVQTAINLLNKDSSYNRVFTKKDFWAAISIKDKNERFGKKEIGRVKLIDGVFQFYKLDNINESPSDKIVKFDGILNIHEGEYLTDILSDIRSLQGITIVRNEDIVNEDLKTKLRIKVDPYPFGYQGEQKIISYLIKKIKQIPGVRDFQKIKHTEQEKTTLSQFKSPTPVKSIEDLLKEIKIEKPGNIKLIPGNYYDFLRYIGKQAIKEYKKLNLKKYYSLEEKNGEKQLWELGYKYIGDEEFNGFNFKQFLDPWDGEELGYGEEHIKEWIKNKIIRLSKKQPNSMNESKIRLKLKK